MNQQVLQRGGRRVFAADTEIDAAGSSGGLFTLEAEHGAMSS
jgi:hypothetical protein